MPREDDEVRRPIGAADHATNTTADHPAFGLLAVEFASKVRPVLAIDLVRRVWLALMTANPVK
jgi:hypothetical protein